MHKLWRLAILIALITASCRIEANLDLAIEDDGSGTYTAEVGLDDELRQALAAFGDPDEILSTLDFGVPNASTSERVEGDMTYSVVTASFDDASELSEMIQEGVDGNPFERFDITVDDEGATVNAAIQLPEALTSAVAEAEDLPSTLEAAVTIQLEMPGRVVSSNADRTIGTNELVWDIDLTDAEVLIEAQSTFQEDGFPFWIIVLVLLVAAALVAWWSWSKRQQEAAVARIDAANESTDA
jgi:hypothetical protein